MTSDSTPEWFLLGNNGEPTGPYTTAEVGERLQQGVLDGNVLACRVGGTEWLVLKRLPMFQFFRKKRALSGVDLVRNLPPWPLTFGAFSLVGMVILAVGAVRSSMERSGDPVFSAASATFNQTAAAANTARQTPEPAGLAIPALNTEGHRALSHLSEFVRRIQSAPASTASRTDCYAEPDDEAGWCDWVRTVEPAPEKKGTLTEPHSFWVRYWKAAPKDFEVQLNYLKGDLPCGLFGATESRRWIETNQTLDGQVKALFRRCRGATGAFQGLEIMTASRNPIDPLIASGMRVFSAGYYKRVSEAELRRWLAP